VKKRVDKAISKNLFFRRVIISKVLMIVSTKVDNIIQKPCLIIVCSNIE